MDKNKKVVIIGPDHRIRHIDGGEIVESDKRATIDGNPLMAKPHFINQVLGVMNRRDRRLLLRQLRNQAKRQARIDKAKERM